MPGQLLVPKFKRPDRPLKEALKKQVREKTIDKHYTTVKLASEGSSFDLGPLTPDAEQLAKINQFTRTPKSAEDVAVLPTLACNDIIDRDFDRFRKSAIEGFAALPQGLNPVGKSFMIGHDYTRLPIGRIFDQEVVDIEGNTFLKLYSYIPNTETNKSYLENVDFGVYWAVSVGVVLEEAKCPVGDEHDWGWSFFNFVCSKGHMKGEYYDPDSDEEDDWGYPIPAKAEDNGAVLCNRDLDAPKDFYELSQVYLGAQYQAELSEKKPLAGIVKAASKGRPIVNLSEKEAKELPKPEDDALSAAFKAHKVTTDDEGRLTWKDAQDLVWVYEDNSGEVLCLGKAAGEEEEEETTETETSSEEDEDTVESAATEESEEEDDEEEDEDEPAEPVASEPEDEEEEEEKAEVPKTATITIDASAVLKHPEFIKFKKEVARKQKEQQKEIDTLRPKAELGETYIKEVRADALSWYVKAHQSGKEEPVKTETFQKILEGLGDNVELIKELASEQKLMAQAKFPSKVRRSSFEDNPAEPERPAELKIDTKTVSKIHNRK